MSDLLFKYPMNVSSETFAFPINQPDHHHHHHHRGLTSAHSSMFANAAPIAVSNKIKAIQTRRPRITLPSYYAFTDLRPLNGGLSNSLATFSNLSPEKLVEHNKDLRLGRVSSRRHFRPSVLSTTSTTNQQSLVWSSYNSPTSHVKQPKANSPTSSGPPINKSSAGNIIPDIHRRSNRAQTSTRQPLTDQENSLIPVESRHKSVPKTKSSVPKAYQRTILKTKSPFAMSNPQPMQILQTDYSKQSNLDNHNHTVRLCESEEDDNNDDENIPLMDEEFEEYFHKAIIKCADWLIRYVFDKKYNENVV